MGTLMGVDIYSDDDCPKNEVYLFPEWLARAAIKKKILTPEQVKFGVKITNIGDE